MSDNFCIHCGAPLVPGADRCTACGKASGPEPATPALPSIPPIPAPTPAPSRAINQGRVAIFCVALVLVAALAGGGVWLGVSSAQGEAGRVQIEQVGAGSGPQPAVSGSSPQPAASGEAKSQVAPSTAPINLSNAEDYRRINLYLSNFSETSFHHARSAAESKPYDSAAPATDDIVQFAINHARFNNRDKWEESLDEGENSYLVTDPAHGIDGGEGWYTTRLPIGTVETIIANFFKIDFDAGSLTGTYHSEGGYVYFRSGQGINPAGVALATEATDLGANRFKVRFDVYFKPYYDATDQSLYGLSSAELKARFGADGPVRTGEAVVETGYANDVAPFKLISYSTVDV